MTWTRFHEGVTSTCSWCGIERPTIEMARVWTSTKTTRDNDDELYREFCHGLDDAKPTCYERVMDL